MSAKILLTLMVIWAAMFLFIRAIYSPFSFSTSKTEEVLGWALLIDTVLIFLMAIVVIWG